MPGRRLPQPLPIVTSPGRAGLTVRAQEGPFVHHARILVADDEPAIGRLLSIELAFAGFEVLTATRGEAAVEQARDEQPDIILADFALPDLGGVDLLARLREVCASPIVVMSGYADPQHKDAALEAGAIEYVTKPFRTADLAEVCRAAFERHRTDRA